MDNKEAIKALEELQLGCFIGSIPYLALEKAIKALDNENKLLQLCYQLEQEKGVHHIHINDVRTTLINDCTTCKYGLEDIDFEKCVKCRETQGYGDWESRNG